MEPLFSLLNNWGFAVLGYAAPINWPTSKHANELFWSAIAVCLLTASPTRVNNHAQSLWRRLRNRDRLIPFSEIRNIANQYGIKFDRYGVNQNIGYELEGKLKEAAALGTITVWGKKIVGPIRDHDPSKPIPVLHFEETSFRHGALDFATPNDHTGTSTMLDVVKRPSGGAVGTFYDLRLTEGGLRSVLKAFGKANASRIAMGRGNTGTEVRANLEHEDRQAERARSFAS